MKKFTKMAGVTLLEVMLVLAVAAMIIVMSIRYYQSATNNAQVNGIISLLQGVQANMDSMAQGAADGYTSITGSQLETVMPLATPWGVPATISGQTATTYTVTMDGTAETACKQVDTKMSNNPKWSITCPTGTGTATYIYSATGT